MKIRNEMKRLFLGVCSIFLLSYAFAVTHTSSLEASTAKAMAPYDAIFNEWSQGNGGSKEWVEILVVNGPLNMQGYQLKDGNSASVVTFSNHAMWSAVPSGSLIVLYNGADRDTVLPADDLDVSDCTAVIGHNNATYFSGNWPAFSNSTATDNPHLLDSGSATIHDYTVDGGAHPGSNTAAQYNSNTAGGVAVGGNWSTGAASAATPVVGNGGVNTTWVNGLCAPPGPEPYVDSTVPTNGASGVATTANITITFNEDVNVTGSWFTINCSVSGGHTAAVTGSGPTTVYTLNPDVDFAGGDVCTVTIIATQVADVDTNNMVSDYVFNFSVPIPAGTCGDPANMIHDIQGAGVTSPLLGANVTIEGVVTSDFQAVGDMNGYFVVEEDLDIDGNILTSEGIFVYDPGMLLNVNVGDVVRIAGTVAEYLPAAGADGTETQISTLTAVDFCSSGNSVTPIAVTFPLGNLTEWEQYEGMLITINQDLVVTEGYNHGRFGEVVMSANGRMLNPTNWDPTWATGTNASDNHNMNRNNRIVISDHVVNSQNPDPIIYPAPGLSAVNTLRGGDRVASGLTANVKYIASINTGANARTSWCAANPEPIFVGTPYGHDCGPNGNYVLETNDPITFIQDNPRPTAPAITGEVKIVSFNVLNYFNGPTFPTPRGATNAAEFTRQRDKIIDAAVVMDADIYGLMEIENDGYAGTSAIADLVNGINALSSRTYAYVNPGGAGIGTDAIAVGLIYDINTFSLVGAADIIDSTYDARFLDNKNRPAIVQTFEHIATGERFNVMVNHLKSKGSSCEPTVWGSPDDHIWQGNCNQTRTKAAEVLVDYMADGTKGNGDTDYILLGDLNGYAQEDPIRTIVEDGFYTPNALTNLFDPATEYSYVFSGQWGSLDYLFVSDALVPYVTGHEDYHINADEPIVLDYNVEFKSAGQQASLYSADQYRSSDHDPAIIALCMSCMVGGNPPPNVSSTTPTNGATGVAVNADVTINFTEMITATGSWFDISCASSGTHTATETANPATTITLNPNVDFTEGELCTVTVFAAQITDDAPQNMAADYVFTFTVFAPAPGCGTAPDLIHQIQGNCDTCSSIGALKTIQAVVVHDLQTTSYAGYYVQEEDTDIDGNVNTSEGIFIYDPTTLVDVNVGDSVLITGQALEFFGLTQLSLDTVVYPTAAAQLCSSGNSVTPSSITFPLATVDDYEWYEGMLVTLPQTMNVTELWQLGRGGNMALSYIGGQDRLWNPTQVAIPGAASDVIQDLNDRSRILIDDSNGNQNVDPIIFPPPALQINPTVNSVRGGDLVDGVQGVMSYSWSGWAGTNAYRIHTTVPPTFTPNNPRPLTAPDVTVSATVKIASFNVLNYFNGDGLGAGFPTARGADTAAEFVRQHDKIVAAAVQLDVDILGLMEIENDGMGANSAIENLILGNAANGTPNGINALSSRTYTYVNYGMVGSDAIAVGLVYDSATIAPIGAPLVLDNSFSIYFNDQKSRPALTQTFEEIATGERFTVIVNHLKSKGSSCDADATINLHPGPPAITVDDDPAGRQGNCNGTRTSAARVLLEWVASDPTASGDPDFIIMGDINAYAMEDPIRTLTDPGFWPLATFDNVFDPATEYSYVFDGQWGTLDHILTNSSLTSSIVGHGDYHINADEPPAIDYDMDFKPVPQHTSLYAPDEYRASDHDPAVVGLCMGAGGAAPVTTVAQTGNNFDIVWALTGAPSYEVHRNTMPYYTPGPATHRITTAGSSYTDIGVVGVTVAQNYYYYVTAPAACGGAALPSNHTGEFDFTIVPGA